MDSDKSVAVVKTCFVVMPVTTPQAYIDELKDVEHFKHVFDYLFIPALKRVGFTVLPPVASGAMLIHADIIEKLEQADLVLCDLSSLNPNVFFELGIRTSLDRPVALVRDDRTAAIPFDVANINMHTYRSSTAPWVLEKEVPNLASHIGNIMQKNATGNELWKYFGLTKRGTPSESLGDSAEARIEAKLDLFMNELSAMVSSVASRSKARRPEVIREIAAMLQEDATDITRDSDTLVISLRKPIGSQLKLDIVNAALEGGYRVFFRESLAIDYSPIVVK